MIDSKYFTRVFQQIPLPALILRTGDGQLIIENGNNAWYAATGLDPAKSLHGKHFFEGFQPELTSQNHSTIGQLQEIIINIDAGGIRAKSDPINLSLSYDNILQTLKWQPEISLLGHEDGYSFYLCCLKEISWLAPKPGDLLVKNGPGDSGAASIEIDQKYRTLFFSSPMPKWIYTVDSFHILDVNDAAIGHYGYSRQEFLKMSLQDIRPASEARRLKQVQQQVRNRSGILQFGIFIHKKKDGSLIQVEVSGNRIYWEEQECMIVVCNDVTLREAAIQKMKENEIRLVNAQKIAKLGYWQLNMAGEMVYVSDQLYQVWDIADPECDTSFNAMMNRVHPADLDMFRQNYHAALAGRERFGFEHRIVLKDGSIKWIQQAGEIIADASGKPVFLAGTAQDITSQKQLMLQVYETNQRFNYVTKATFDAIWDWDIVTGKVIWGEGYVSLFGKMQDNHLTDLERVNRRIHPDDIVNILSSAVTSLKSRDDNWNYEHRYLKADGSFAFVSNKAVIIRDNKGRAIRVIGAMQDISRQKAEQERLKLMESVITHTNDAVLITAASGESGLHKIIYVNASFTILTGYMPDDVYGKTPAILEGSASDKAELERISAAVKKGVPCQATIVYYRKNGKPFWMSFSLSPVTDKKGSICNWISIQRDVSQMKSLELEKELMANISTLFNKEAGLQQTLEQVLDGLIRFGNFRAAEVWLTERNIRSLYKTVSFPKQTVAGSAMLPADLDLMHTQLATAAFESGLVQVIEHAKIKKTARSKTSGRVFSYALPVSYKNEAIGVLLFDLADDSTSYKDFAHLFENLGSQIGAEIKRKQLEEELNQLFINAPDIICIAGYDGFFKKINPAACALLGYSEQELLSTPCSKFLYPDDRNAWDIVTEKPGPYFENRYLARNGKVKWLAWTSVPSPEEGLVFALAKDITEKKSLEELLEKANRLAKIGSWEWDLVKNTIHWSDITKQIYEVAKGFEPEPGAGIMFYKEGRDREVITEKMQEASIYGRSWDIESIIITASGNEKWVRSIGEAEMINGSCVRIYGSFQDIDTGKKNELAILEASEAKNVILESIADAFFAVDRTWKITYWNRQAEKLTGSKKEFVLHRNLWDLFPDAKELAFYRYYVNALESGVVQHFEEYYPPLNVWLEVTAYPSANGLAVYFRDVTERKISEIHLRELNEELHKHARELAVSNAELEQFAYVASHDLQEPLRMIASFLTLLEKKYEHVIDEKGKKYIDFAIDGARRMRLIILDLLEFSRIGRTDDLRESVNLSELLDEIKLLFYKQVEEMSAQIYSDPLPVIHAFRAPIRQVFHNIIGNALKYARKDIPVHIVINVKELPAEWEFHISDNGIGIEEQFFDRIFVIFQRLHNRDEFSGTGMGLAITKKIIETSGGHIWVSSVKNEGSTFSFTIKKETRQY